LTYSEHLRERIEASERLIELHENGRSNELPRAYQPVDADATKQEIEYLRGRNEKYRAVLRWEEAMDRIREAHSVVFQQWLTPGSFGLTPTSLQAFDAADQELQAAKAAVDRITEGIRARFR